MSCKYGGLDVVKETLARSEFTKFKKRYNIGSTLLHIHLQSLWDVKSVTLGLMHVYGRVAVSHRESPAITLIYLTSDPLFSVIIFYDADARGSKRSDFLVRKVFGEGRDVRINFLPIGDVPFNICGVD